MDEKQIKKYKKYAMSRLEKEFKNACKQGNLELIEFFIFSPELPKNLDPLVDNCAGLRWACGNNQLEVVKFFLESPKLKNHAKVNINSNEPFRRAAENGSMEVMRYLMSKDEFKNKIEVHEWSDYALRKACANGYFEMAKYLLTSPEMHENCDINSINLIDFELCATQEMREQPPQKTDKREILKFILAQDKYEIKSDDIAFLLKDSNYRDLIKYIIVELEKNFKLNPKKHIAPDVQKMIDIINDKNQLKDELHHNAVSNKKSKI